MRRAVLPCLILLTALVASTAVAAPAPGGWGQAFADAQGTQRGAGIGPEVPAVKWANLLVGTETNGRHDTVAFGASDLLVIDGMGHPIIRVQDTTGASDVDVLIALDPDTGEEAWRREGFIPGCVPAIDDEGRVWAVSQPSVSDPVVLQALDPATGETVPGTSFGDAEATGALDTFLACDSNFDAPLRILDNGSILTMERSYAGGGGFYLRAIDPSTQPPTQQWVIELDTPHLSGSYGGFASDLRTGDAGSPNAGTIYLFERTQGPGDSGVGEDDDLYVHSLDAATGAFIDEVLVPGNEFWPNATVLLGTRLYLSTEEEFPGDDPSVDADVNGWVVAVDDDGEGNLSVVYEAPTSEAASPASDELSWHLAWMTAGTGQTLIGRTRGTQGLVHAVDAATGTEAWDVPGYNCLTDHVVADADGNVYTSDFCDEVIFSVSPTGRVRWALPTEGEVPQAGGGTIDLARFDGFEAQAVTPEGVLYVTAGPFSDEIGVIAITLGAATDRREGTNRIETAVELSQTIFPADGTVRTVVLARHNAYPDALAGAPLAYEVGGPLLLTEPSGLSAPAEAEIDRLGATHAILLGGEAALSPAVVDDLVAAGIDAGNIERIAGANRFDTAAKVAGRLGSTHAVVVEGANPDPRRGWPDAVAASGFAARTGRAILLVTRDRLPAETRGALLDNAMRTAIVVGGTAAVSQAVQDEIDGLSGDLATERLSGPSRYATSVAVAERSLAEGSTLDVLWLATGTGFADALSAGPAAAFTSGVLLLVNGQNADGGPEAYTFLGEHAGEVGAVFLVGGTAAISDEVAAKIDDMLGR